MIVAVFLITVPVGTSLLTFTVKVRFTPVPGCIVPMFQTTCVPAAFNAPLNVVEHPTNVVFDGIGSVTVRLFIAIELLLCTVKVYTIWSPGFTREPDAGTELLMMLTMGR